MALPSATGLIFAILTFLQVASHRVEDKLGTLWETGVAAQEALEKQLRAEIEKVGAVEQQGRHDLAGGIQHRFDGLTREMRELERTTVRKEDMKALEDRLNSHFDRIDGCWKAKDAPPPPPSKPARSRLTLPH